MREKARLALLGLWSIRGFGTKRLAALQAQTKLEDIAELPCKAWLGAIPLPPFVVQAFAKQPNLQTMGERLLWQAQRARMQLLFREEEGFPPGLEALHDVPPVLFAWGDTSPLFAPKLAMVGPRKIEAAFVPVAKHFAQTLAQEGALVVSGAAEGVDAVCLEAAMEVAGRAWAFLGCGLDCLGVRQQLFWKQHMRKGGTYFSEYPPGTAADKTTFPRRNRLIAAASDAVLVLRAPQKSGSLYTAEYAQEQRRPLWVVLGEREAGAEGCVALLKQGLAREAQNPEEVLAALGNFRPTQNPFFRGPTLGENRQRAAPEETLFSLKEKPLREANAVLPLEVPALNEDFLSTLGPEARLVWTQLGEANVFEELLAATQMEAGALSAILCELELLGRVVQKPGKRYERL